MKYYNRTYPSNHELPFHKVTHRHDKSIPECTLAPREGIYRPMTASEAQAECTVRVQRYAEDVEAYGNGKLPKEEIFSSFEAPIFGAYGERL
jgi:hypothetical protein